jgi:hypothetical protein
VYIIPIISRSVEGTVIPEVGAGGGAGDLIRSHDLELKDLEDDEIAKLKTLCIEKAVGPEARRKTLDFISRAFQSGQKVVSLDALDLDTDEQHMPLAELAARLVKLADQDYVISPKSISTASDKKHGIAARDFKQEPLPRKIVNSLGSSEMHPLIRTGVSILKTLVLRRTLSSRGRLQAC